MAVTRRLRYEILRRDNHTCRYCGQGAPDVKLTVDHVTPVALGGKDEAANLVTACQPCNAGKTSSAPDAPLVDDVAADALRWAQARTATINEWRQKRRALAADLEDFRQAWEGWTYGKDSQTFPMEGDWRSAVERWLDEGFTADDLIDMIPRAMRNPSATSKRKPITPEGRWRYYCGVVWRTLDQIQAATSDATSEDTQETTGPGPTEEALADAYTRGEEAGYAQGKAEIHAEWNDALAEGDTNTQGFIDALSWAVKHAATPGTPESGQCDDCKTRQAYGTTSRCLPCWMTPLLSEDIDSNVTAEDLDRLNLPHADGQGSGFDPAGLIFGRSTWTGPDPTAPPGPPPCVECDDRPPEPGWGICSACFGIEEEVPF